ncbi:S-adenosyl-L-homocysteine hydrolase [Qipengyuania sediminis]|uniref:S-adenosyl-L-homocysteine hydrolase n=1 Tax=Qipengyuania sediminis TaxID=1532023 RepID=UPI001059AF0F|nr:S-adenosyl-L-homocysteine hydrolase [Qipengyuania sediminis]
MKFIANTTASLAALAVLATPLPAQASATDDAEAVRKLDIMLMVTSLRCRKTADNFQADYQRFSSSHLATLNAASRTLQADLVKSGNTGKRALDKISVSMANAYGNGHPWLGCGELKRITQDLTKNAKPTQLATAAQDLLSARPRGQWAMAGGR